MEKVEREKKLDLLQFFYPFSDHPLPILEHYWLTPSVIQCEMNGIFYPFRMVVPQQRENSPYISVFVLKLNQ